MTRRGDDLRYMNTDEFHKMLLEAIAEDHGPKTLKELAAGIADGWACRWPDCQLQEFGCGTRYGCNIAKAGATVKRSPVPNERKL